MKIYEDKSLLEFEFWSGAVPSSKTFTNEEMDRIEKFLSVEYPNGISSTELNNLFWFEDKWLCEMIGIDYENDFLKREWEF